MAPLSLTDRTSALPGFTPGAVPVALARQLILDSIVTVTDQQSVLLNQALGRILTENLLCPIDVPAHDNSAMDGYALSADNLPVTGVARFAVRGTRLAGPLAVTPPEASTPIELLECVRIMTGAMMPPGCDTVVPQELVALQDDQTIIVRAGTVHRGENRRLRGEDLQQHSVALARGRCLRPSDLGLLASLGINRVKVFRPVRVAFFSTGDELRSLGEPLPPGCVFDANRYTLLGMLQRLGCELVDLGLVADTAAALQDAFIRASEQADLVITSGGVSVGDADLTKKVMVTLGDIQFWTIAMRPGRPLAFGHIHSADGGAGIPVFGLPGNPVAVMVTFYFLVRDALIHLQGGRPEPLPMLQVRCAHAIRKRPSRTEYQRASVQQDAKGQTLVAVTGAQGSGILSSMSAANAIIVLEHERGDVAAGEWVSVILMDGLI